MPWVSDKRILPGRYCQARILGLLDDLIPPPAESGLLIRNEALAKVSRPVTEARQLTNWVNSTPTPAAEQELEALRKLPRTWFDRLKVFVEIESQVQLLRAKPNEETTRL